MTVHKALGPGLLESTYEECLYYEILQSGLRANKQVPLPLVYKEVHLNCGYRVDIIVENQVLIEVKSVEAIHDLHVAQILTYLKLSGCHLGLLINFNVTLLKEGYKRFANKL